MPPFRSPVVLCALVPAVLGGCASGPGGRFASLGEGLGFARGCGDVLADARRLSNEAIALRRLSVDAPVNRPGTYIVAWPDVAPDGSPEAGRLAFEMMAVVGETAERACPIGFKRVAGGARGPAEGSARPT